MTYRKKIKICFKQQFTLAPYLQITSTGANTGVVTTTTIHTDFLGSPVAETNATGTVTRVERYTPYGEPSDLQLDVGPGFTGHATDVLTGLTYMQQRYMDQEIGRFLTPDPVGPEEDFINHFNRYNYAQNNPVRYIDPDGRTGRNPADPFPCPQSRNPASCPGGLSNTLPLDGAKKEKPPTPTPPAAAAAAAAPAAPKPDEEGYWDRVNERFMETNREIPGMIALPGMGIISAGAAARAVGAQTLMQAAGNQVANGLVNYAGAIPAPVNWAGAFQGAALNFVAVGVSFEVGLYVGSAIYVAGSDAFFGPPANLSIDCKCQEGK